MEQHLLLGIDVGSSSVKASLVDIATGRRVASAFYPEREAPILSVKAGWAEQEPDSWWQYTKLALRKVMDEAGAGGEEPGGGPGEEGRAAGLDGAAVDVVERGLGAEGSGAEGGGEGAGAGGGSGAGAGVGAGVGVVSVLLSSCPVGVTSLLATSLLASPLSFRPGLSCGLGGSFRDPGLNIGLPAGSWAAGTATIAPHWHLTFFPAREFITKIDLLHCGHVMFI